MFGRFAAAIVMDKDSRQIIAFHVGDRSRESAKELWKKIPEKIREYELFHTDDWSDRRCGQL
jgi:insertion element IS1 protein InsB